MDVPPDSTKPGATLAPGASRPFPSILAIAGCGLDQFNDVSIRVEYVDQSSAGP